MWFTVDAPHADSHILSQGVVFSCFSDLSENETTVNYFNRDYICVISVHADVI